MKSPWVNVGGTWRKVTNVWLNVGGAWKQKTVPKVNVGGNWKEIIQYLKILYENGKFYAVFTKHLGGSVEYNSNNFVLRTGTSSLGNVALVTREPVDISNFNVLKATITRNGGNTSTTRLGVQLSEEYTTPQILASVSNNELLSTPTTIGIDISQITGECFVSVANLYNHSASGSCTVYKIWLE